MQSDNHQQLSVELSLWFNRETTALNIHPEDFGIGECRRSLFFVNLSAREDLCRRHYNVPIHFGNLISVITSALSAFVQRALKGAEFFNDWQFPCHDFSPRIINRSSSTVRCIDGKKKRLTHWSWKNIIETRGLGLTISETTNWSVREGDSRLLRFPPCYLIPSRGSVLCRDAYGIVYVYRCALCARISCPWKSARIHRIFFCSLKVKEGHRCSRENRIVFLSSGVTGICRYFPRDSPIYPGPGCLLLTRRYHSWKASSAFIIFPHFLLRPCLPLSRPPRICVASA